MISYIYVLFHYQAREVATLDVSAFYDLIFFVCWNILALSIAFTNFTTLVCNHLSNLCWCVGIWRRWYMSVAGISEGSFCCRPSFRTLSKISSIVPIFPKYTVQKNHESKFKAFESWIKMLKSCLKLFFHHIEGISLAWANKKISLTYDCDITHLPTFTNTVRSYYYIIM